MASEGDHTLKAKQNELFADSLDKSDPICESWAVVAAFYSALHYLESYFARYSVNCGNHDGREKEIKRDIRIRPALAPYKFLYAQGRTARYHCVGLKPQTYVNDIKPRLTELKRQIEHALSRTAGGS